MHQLEPIKVISFLCFIVDKLGHAPWHESRAQDTAMFHSFEAHPREEVVRAWLQRYRPFCAKAGRKVRCRHTNQALTLAEEVDICDQMQMFIMKHVKT